MLSGKNYNKLFKSSIAVSLACIILGLYGFRFKFENNPAHLILFARILSVPFIFFSLMSAIELFRYNGSPYVSVSQPPTLSKNWIALAFILAISCETLFFNTGTPAKMLWLPAPKRALILSQIYDACAVISERGNPYFGGTRMHFMYLPVLMLPYMAAFVLKIDLTIVNIVPFLVLGWFTVKLAKTAKSIFPANLVAVAAVLLSAKNIQMVMYGHLPFYWLLMFLVFYTLTKKDYFACSVFMGLALATRQETTVLALPFAAYFIRREGVGRFIKYGIAAFCIYALFIIPAWAMTGNSFWYYTYFKMVRGFEQYFSGMGVPFDQISISTFLYGVTGKAPLILLQAVLILSACLGTWLKLYKSPAKFTALCGILLVLFVSLNLLVQWYYYTTGLILIALSILFISTAREEFRYGTT